MNFKIVRRFSVVLGFALCANYAVAQSGESHGSEALLYYYSDLNAKLSDYELNEVPFDRQQVKVQRGQSIVDIARRLRFRELDFYHLAAALYEANPQAFENNDASLLKTGATLQLPTVRDLIAAQTRYENLKVVGDTLYFNNPDNQMRQAQRWPFGKSLVLIGPQARDELPSNQEVTLTSYRPDGLSGSKNGAASNFLSRATSVSSNTSVNTNATQVAKAPVVDPNRKWLSAIDKPASITDGTLLGNSSSDQILSLPLAVTTPVVEPEVQPVAIPAATTDAVSKAVSGAETAAKYPEQSVVAVEPEPPVEQPVKAELVIADAPKAQVVPITKAEPLSVAKAEPAQDVQKEDIEVAMVQPAPAKKVNKVPAPEKPAVAETKKQPAAELAKEPVTVAVAEQVPLPKAEKVVVPEVMPEPKIKQAVVSKSAIARDTSLATEVVDQNSYLGPPRNAATPASNDIQSDPLSYIVEWDFDENASVGTALNRLAEFIGYELVSEDDTVLNTYTRRLPKPQLRVSEVSAEAGFNILAGRGLETVFDHVARSVKHVPKQSRKLVPQVSAALSSDTHARFIQQAGIAAFLKEFPADIQSAAGRHASRCESEAVAQLPDAERIHNVVVGSIQEKVPELVAKNLVDWFESPTGRKVLELEQAAIDNAKLKKFSVDKKRLERIQQIYNDTVTGKGIASIAVELDYSGWALSGCKQKAERSGNVQEMQKELSYGQGIRKKFVKLESILKDDMVRSMAFLFSPLSESELTEYAEVTREHAGIYSELQESIIDAIEFETKEINLSSL